VIYDAHDIDRAVRHGFAAAEELTERLWRENVQGIVDSWRDSAVRSDTDFGRGLDAGINLVCAALERLLHPKDEAVAS